jgi:HSP20 family protein
MSDARDQPNGLNEVLGGVRRIVEALNDAVNNERTVERTVHFGSEETIDGVVGVRVQTGIGGTTVSVREGAEPLRPDGEAAAETRRPVVEVYDEKEQIRVVAEMAGVGAEDLELTVDANKLVLSAETDRRRYWRAVSLPRPVDAEEAVVQVEAGLVEIVFPAPDQDDQGLDT